MSPMAINLPDTMTLSGGLGRGGGSRRGGFRVTRFRPGGLGRRIVENLHAGDAQHGHPNGPAILEHGAGRCKGVP